jgi:hypothetical protein
MEFNLKELTKYNTLCFLDKKNLLVSKSNHIYVFDLDTKSFSYCISLPCSIKTKLILFFNLTSRIFRSDIVYGIHFFNNNYLICFEKYIYNVDIISRYSTKVFTLSNGRRPLSILNVKNSLNFKDGAYFGEYFGNPKKNEVKIFRINPDFTFQQVFLFEKGLIDHVHALVYDTFRECMWILTGDFNEAAAIWQVKSDFKIVNLILGGEQKYRACVAFPLNEGLLYATDSQYQVNSINLLTFKEGVWDSIPICNINGPVIYGTKFNNKFIFSTSVEGISSDRSILMRYLDRKIGPGIIEDYSHIIIGNIEEGFKTIYKLKKDPFPFVLFQFGVFTFPNGLNLTSNIIVSPKALRTNKKTLSFKY